MKKTVKQSLIWGTVALGLAGTVTGITVPILNAKNEERQTKILNYNENVAIDGHSVKNWWEDQEKSSQTKETTLVSKVEREIAFKLYDEEQAGSIEMQRAYFEWKKHTQVKTMIDFLRDTLNVTYTITGTDIAATYADVKTKITTQITAETDVDRKKDLNERFDSMTKAWEDNLKNIDTIDKKTFNWSATDFSTKFPKILLPQSEIRAKQVKEYEEQMNAFVNNFKTKAEGEDAWYKALPGRYNGAKNKTEAVDAKVFNLVSKTAYARFKYTVNSSFTYEQYKSGVFADYLGTFDATLPEFDATNPNANPNRKVFVKKIVTGNHEGTEKVYYFGSLSNTKAWNNRIAHIPSSIKHLTRTHNAILGFKQDKDSISAPWTVDKKMLVKLFQTITTTDTKPAIEKWADIFKSGKEDLTKELIASHSMTTDKTQHNSGDLGYMEPLDNLGMVPGFALGTLAIMGDTSHDKVLDGQHIDSNGHATTGTGDSFLKVLMDAMKTSFTNYLTAKGITLPTLPGTVSTPAQIKELDDYNKEIANIFNIKMTDDEVKQYFGKVVRDVYAKLTKNDGTPVAIEVSPGVYMVLNDEYGIHVIKFEKTATGLFETNFKADMQRAANDQSWEKISTNWVDLMSKHQSSATNLRDLMGIEYETPAGVANPNPAIDATWETFLKNKYEKLGYTASNSNEIAKDLINAIKNEIQAENIGRVDRAVKDSLYKWLEGKINKGLFTDGKDGSDTYSTLLPNEIYNIAIKQGGA